MWIFYFGYLFGEILASYRMFFVPDVQLAQITIVIFTPMFLGLIPLAGYYAGFKMGGREIPKYWMKFVIGFVIYKSSESILSLSLVSDQYWYLSHVLAFVLSFLVVFRVRKSKSEPVEGNS
jgi:hypothetical protein